MNIKQEISPTVLYERIARFAPSLVYEDFQEYFPSVDQEAIDTGILTRYFVRQANHQSGYITEIDEPTYSRLRANKLYNTLELPWRVGGKLDDEFGPRTFNTPIRTYTGVKTANELTLAEAEKEMPGISMKLVNRVQFWIGR